MENIPKGWKLSASNKGGLFTLVRTHGLEKSFDYAQRLKAVTLGSKHRDHISLTISPDFVTITLDNYENEEQVPTEDFIEIANLMNQQLKI